MRNAEVNRGEWNLMSMCRHVCRKDPMLNIDYRIKETFTAITRHWNALQSGVVRDYMMAPLAKKPTISEHAFGFYL